MTEKKVCHENLSIGYQKMQNSMLTPNFFKILV
jgi:hypothetical protein